jgi:hypothetical protein
MLWAVRGTLPQNQQDITIVVEAAGREEAEYMGWRRGIPVVIVEPATAAEIDAARDARLLWRYSSESRYCAFGQPIRTFQLVSLMISGFLTIILLIDRAGVSRLLHF